MVRHFSKLTFARHFDFERPLMKDPFSAMIVENVVGTSSAAFLRRSLAQRVGHVNRIYRISGDYDYWLRCSMLAPYVVLSDVLFYKRTHGTNISANTVLMMKEHQQILKVMASEVDGLPSSRRWEQGCRREAARVGYRIGHFYFKQGDRMKAFECYFHGLGEHKTPLNFLKFLVVVLKKLIRCVVA